MASGSSSTLAQYSAAVSCSNTGPTNVSGTTTLPINVKPVYGDAISCVITNTPVPTTATFSGRVFADNGTGGGTAHNGVVDGSETGLGGVLVRAMSGSTVLASTTTNADGSFVLTLTPGTPVDIVVTPATGYLAISENVGNTGAGNASVTDSKIRFTPVAGVNYSGVLFGEVLQPSFVPDQMRNVTPGGTVFLPHTFTAHTAGTVDFSVITPVATPNIPGWSTMLFLDSNCNGAFDSGEPAITGSVPVTDGSKVCIILRVTAPSGAPVNAQFQAKVQALMHYSNSALTSTLLVNDTVTVADSSSVTLIKKVNTDQAHPGDVLIYTVIYRNDSSSPVSKIVIDDATPTYTTYVGSSAICSTPLPQSVTSCAANIQPAGGGTGTIEWTQGGSLQPGAQGSVQFSVQVRQ